MLFHLLEAQKYSLLPTTLPAIIAWMALLTPCLLRGEGLVPKGLETVGFSLQVSMWSTGRYFLKLVGEPVLPVPPRKSPQAAMQPITYLIQQAA